MNWLFFDIHQNFKGGRKMQEKIEEIKKQAEEKIKEIKNSQELQEFKVKMLGKKSELSGLLKTLGSL